MLLVVWGCELCDLFCFCCSLLLDNERWKQAEVPAEFQDLVNSIEDGVIALPEKKAAGPFTTYAPLHKHPSLGSSGLLQTACFFIALKVNFFPFPGPQEGKPPEFLAVDGEKYAVVG